MAIIWKSQKEQEIYLMVFYVFVSHLLTLQAFTDEHPKPPPPVQGSLKDILIETLRAFVKGVEAVIYAVGGTVSAKLSHNLNQLRDGHKNKSV
jgi:hypothetical protein